MSPAGVVSVVVLVIFGGAAALAFLLPFPEGSKDVLVALLGVIGGFAGTVVNYWLGSSSGSARKTEILDSERKP